MILPIHLLCVFGFQGSIYLLDKLDFILANPHPDSRWMRISSLKVIMASGDNKNFSHIYLHISELKPSPAEVTLGEDELMFQQVFSLS
jgi:hypothetical protein